MNQIFYWLREQTEINKKDAEQRYERQLEILSTIAPHYGGKISAYCEMLGLVSQAEAKWKAEVCEWRLSTNADYIAPTYETKCGKAIAEIRVSCNFAYCPYCGKPIKISEVE